MIDELKMYETTNAKEFLEFITKLYEEKYPNCKKYDGEYINFDNQQSYLFFRGQSNYEWELEPSICGQKKREWRILKKVRYKNICNLKDVIAYTQHYRMRTRAIDFTSDFKVALYFACENDFNNDGALFIGQYAPHNDEWISSLTINIVATNKRNQISCEKLASKLINNKEYNNLYKNRDNDKDIKFICAEIASYLNSGFMVVYDYENEKFNQRLTKQKGALFYCGSNFYLNNGKCVEIKSNSTIAPLYTIKLHEINKPDISVIDGIKIRIPQNLKKEILKIIGINRKELGF